MTRNQIQIKIDEIYQRIYDYSCIVNRKLKIKEKKMIHSWLNRIKSLEKKRDRFKKVSFATRMNKRLKELKEESLKNV